ncbi:MAG: response regulator [Nitrospiraceae bacterium]|nr:response regulator [Nitrospiraceae bacterium]
MESRILIVDDDPVVREVLEQIIARVAAQKPDVARDGMEGLQKAQDNEYDIIFTDLKMPRLGGMDFLKGIKKARPEVSVVVITGFPTVENAVSAMKEGADDFITKPFSIESVQNVIARLNGTRKISRESGDSLSHESVKRLNSDLFSKIQKINLLQSISSELDGINSNFEVYEKIVGMTSKLLFAREVSFGMVESGYLKVKQAKGIRETDVPIAGSFLEKVIRNGKHYVAQAGEVNPHTGNLLTAPMLSIPFSINGEVYGLLNASDKSDGTGFSEDEVGLGLTFAKKVALRIENNALYDVFYSSMVSALKSLVNSIEARDSYTKQHSERVTDYSLQIAEAMGLGEDEKNAIGFGGYLHDIGKIGVRDTVLLKPGTLNEDELAEIRLHPIIGDNIMAPLRFLPKEKALIRHHHERFDGKGYPDGIAGDEIPMIVRILSVADTYDAMTSVRPYRSAKPHQSAIKELIRCSDSQFDGTVVEAFCQTPAGKGVKIPSR